MPFSAGPNPETWKKMSKADKRFYWIFIAVTWSAVAYVRFFY